MQLLDGEQLRQAWQSKGHRGACAHPIYDRERTGTTDTGRFLCIVCGTYLSSTYGRQQASNVRLIQGLSLMEWTEPSGETHQLRFHDEKWWHRPKTHVEAEWRPGLPPGFCFGPR